MCRFHRGSPGASQVRGVSYIFFHLLFSLLSDNFMALFSGLVSTTIFKCVPTPQMCFTAGGDRCCNISVALEVDFAAVVAHNTTHFSDVLTMTCPLLFHVHLNLEEAQLAHRMHRDTVLSRKSATITLQKTHSNTLQS